MSAMVEGLSKEAATYEIRIAKTDEMRGLDVERRLAMGEEHAADTDKDKREYEVGDLVRHRRLAQDNQRSRKLEPRWEGPYTVANFGFGFGAR